MNKRKKRKFGRPETRWSNRVTDQNIQEVIKERDQAMANYRTELKIRKNLEHVIVSRWGCDAIERCIKEIRRKEEDLGPLGPINDYRLAQVLSSNLQLPAELVIKELQNKLDTALDLPKKRWVGLFECLKTGNKIVDLTTKRFLITEDEGIQEEFLPSRNASGWEKGRTWKPNEIKIILMIDDSDYLNPSEQKKIREIEETRSKQDLERWVKILTDPTSYGPKESYSGFELSIKNAKEFLEKKLKA